ncbi:MAG TPA: DMT family transporter [Patescibacteria group bacterium]|nr:DMT family transporter [Patescibacteria group bacterium]
MDNRNKLRGAVIALIIANFIWGAGPPIYKWVLEDIGPFTLAFARFFFASFVLLPFAYKHLKIERGDIKKLFLIAFLGISINISFFFVGLQNAPSINAGIIGSAAPIFIIFGSIMFLKERPKGKVIIGSNIGLIGVLIIILSPLLKQGFNMSTSVSFFGNMMLLISMFGNMSITILGRKLVEKYEPIAITFWSSLIGSLTFFPFFFNELASNNWHLNLTPRSEGGILFGIIFSSSLAYFLFYHALKYMKASDTGVFTYLDPIATILIAVPLLHEIPGPFFILGSVFVFLGIYIAEGRIHWHPIHLLRR